MRVKGGLGSEIGTTGQIVGLRSGAFKSMAASLSLKLRPGTFFPPAGGKDSTAGPITTFGSEPRQGSRNDTGEWWG